jgi:hypothetical protein
MKDWEGEDWDVHEEYNTQVGIIVSKGWLYGVTPKNGGSSGFSYILTDEIAEYITQHSIVEIVKTLGFSEYVVRKFRKTIGFYLEHPLSYSFEWILEHQDEIIYDSFEVLSQKYGLTPSQSAAYTFRLVQYGVVRKHHQRETILEREQRQWFQANKQKLSELDIKGIEQNFNVKHHTARKLHTLVCKEKNIPTQAEEWHQQLKDKKQWLLDNQIELLQTDITLKEIAQRFNTNKLFIRECRVQLRTMLKISIIGQKQEWAKQHQNDLEVLTIKQMQEKYKLGRYAIKSYRKLLIAMKQNEN